MKVTRITIEMESESGTRSVKIEHPRVDLHIDEMWEMLVRPALLGMTYAEASVDGLRGEHVR